ncbi:hypothetical protein SADUNF_Sadunf02G0140500 [Salix dunnii]|uniref:Mitochondrial carrier protein n=1 Tax=Salix dunnii TaxID=1413687 RepID=A0A835N7U6_9ROSI|nr:hypothetical protein SADUNF_Sadunf02G0140500 [Salix dunnii]
MASEDVKASESAVTTIVNLAEEAKLAREGVKAPSLAILSICKSLVAGGVAGGVSRTAVAPLERLKILLQVQNPHNVKYNGTIQGLKYIWRTEGFRGLFKGNGTNCARIVPNSAVKFFSYEQASKYDSLISLVVERHIFYTIYADMVLTMITYELYINFFAFFCPAKVGFFVSDSYTILLVLGINLHFFLQTFEFSSVHDSYKYPFITVFMLVFTYVSLSLVPPEDAQLTPLLRLGAGACAGIIAMSATYPMDMTEKSPYQYRGMFHALSSVLRQEGPRALYRGWLPSVIGVTDNLASSFPCLKLERSIGLNTVNLSIDVLMCGKDNPPAPIPRYSYIPYVGLNFSVYESLKDWLVKTRPFGLAEDSELSVTTRLACGAAAGTVGQTVAYPLDVIRRRMQMVGWKGAASIVTGDGRSKAPLEYTGMIDAFRKTVRHEGFGALYKGLVPNSVKVVPSIAIAFVTYEMVKDILGVEFRISD